mmetsp:Transcript_127777/g.232369  ORF Transcript_127777/g.232369 Transcript_127777/m.232369 type:complete len:98 (+) Transcript_127777:50-343(+)
MLGSAFCMDLITPSAFRSMRLRQQQVFRSMGVGLRSAFRVSGAPALSSPRATCPPLPALLRGPAHRLLQKRQVTAVLRQGLAGALCGQASANAWPWR